MAPESLTGHRLILIGGFLGAGKTTLLIRFAHWLKQLNIQVGVITNDQGDGLVDTQTAMDLLGTDVNEVKGGCFCCKLNELADVLSRRLPLHESRSSDRSGLAILAEPVGSCTDLVATVVLPLQSIYRLPMSVAPFCVVLDSRRALAALGGKKSRRDFSKDVGYIYQKQIEEAQWLIVNKSDLLASSDIDDLKRRLSEHAPNKRIFVVSGKTGDGCQILFEEILANSPSAPNRDGDFPEAPRSLEEIDYQRYGKGEALLGWYNATVKVESVNIFDGNSWIIELARNISRDLDSAGCEVAHFKMSLTAGDSGAGGRQASSIARIHQTTSEEEPVMAQRLERGLADGDLLINLRAEGCPRLLERVVETALFRSSETHSIQVIEKASFRPGQPVPIHRLSN